MQLKDGFITHEGADEHITVPVGGLSFSGMVRSNKTAGFIVECLKEDVTEAEIIERMLAKYDASNQRITIHHTHQCGCKCHKPPHGLF